MAVKDVDNGLKIGDVVFHSLSGTRGKITGFEWAGVRRAIIENNKTMTHGWRICNVHELIKVGESNIDEVRAEIIIEDKEITKVE